MTVKETTTTIQRFIDEYNKHTNEMRLQGCLSETDYLYFDEYAEIFDYLFELDRASVKMYKIPVYHLRNKHITMDIEFETHFKNKDITFNIETYDES